MLLHLPVWSSRYFGNIRLPLQYGNHQVGFDSIVSDAAHSLLWSVTRADCGLRCFNSAWQLVP
jgi:hypothetical protein